MVNMNSATGGVDIINGQQPTAQDWLDTWQRILDSTGNLQVESNYKIFDASGNFENSGLSAVEKFSSAGGAKSTVNTIATTAFFDTDNYTLNVSPGGNDIIEVTGLAQDSTSSITDSKGLRFKPLLRSFLKSVEKMPASTSTRAILKTDAGLTISTATFSGDIATFSPLVQLQANDYYRIEVDNSSGSYTSITDLAAGFPITTTNIEYDSGSINGAGNSNDGFNIENLTIQDITENLIDSVTCDSNTLDITSVTNSFALAWIGDFLTNTSGSFDLSDGINTINLPVDPISKKTGFIKKDSLSTTTDIKVIPKLETTIGGTRPTIKGWSLITI